MTDTLKLLEGFSARGRWAFPLAIIVLFLTASFASGQYYFEKDSKINVDENNRSFQRGASLAIYRYNGEETLVAVYQSQEYSVKPAIMCRVSTNGGLTWGDEVKISPDDSNSHYDPDVYAANGRIYVVWTTVKSTGKSATMFSYSVNGGLTFSTPVEVNPAGTIDEKQPAVAADPYGHVYVVWWVPQFASQGGGIYLAFSSNNGVGFSAPFRLPLESDVQNPHNSQRSPDVAADDKRVYVVWYADTEYEFNILYSYANINATTTSLQETDFTKAKILNYDTSQDDSDQTHPKIAAAGGNVIVVWNDFREENGPGGSGLGDKKFTNNQQYTKSWNFLTDNSSVYYTVSHDYGSTFSVGGLKDRRLNLNDTLNQIFPTVAVNETGEVVAVAWTDLRYGNVNKAAIFCRISTDGGRTFGGEKRISEYYVDSYNALPSTAVSLDGNTVYAAWESNRGSDRFTDIYLGTSESTNHRPVAIRYQYGSISANEYNITFAWEMTHVADFFYYEVHYSTQANFTPTSATLYTKIYDQERNSVTIEGLQPNTTYYATVVVVDREGLKSVNNPYVTVKTKRVNLPPRLIKPIPDLQFHEDMGDGKGLLNLTGYFWDDYYLGYNYSLYYEIEPPYTRQKNITAVIRTEGRYPVVDFAQKNKDWYGTESFRIIASDLGKDGVMSGDDLKAYSNWFNVTVLPTNDPPAILEVQDALGNVFSVRNKRFLNITGDNGAQQGSEYMMTVVAEDVDEDPITFTVDSEKVSVSPDPEHPTTMAHLSFTPTNDDVGFFTFTVNASDPNGGYSLLRINMSVKNINDPPFFTEVAGRSIPLDRTIVLNGTEGVPLWFIVKGDDPDLRFGDSLILTVSSSRFNVSRVDTTTFNVSFTPTNEDSVAGSVSADLVLMDRIRTIASNGPVHLVINVANAPDPPVLRSLKITAKEDYPPQRQPGTFNIGEPVLFTVNITDPDGDTITVTWDFGDNTTGTGFSVVHSYEKEGRYVINVSYTDGVFTLTRTDVVRIVSDGDDDNDGLKDVWEIQFFGDLSHGPNEDPDGDGYNNRAEIGIERDTPFDPTDPNSPGTGTSGGQDKNKEEKEKGINMGIVIGVVAIAAVAAVIAFMVFFIKKKMKQRELEEEEKLKSIELKTKEEIEEWRRIYGDEIKVGEVLKPEERPVSEEEIDLGGGIIHEAGDEGSIHELPSEEEGPGWISAGEGPVFDESAPGPLFGESMQLETIEVDEESGTVEWGPKDEEIEEEIKPEDILPEGVSADEVEVDLEDDTDANTSPAPPPPPPPPVKREEEE